MIKYVKGILEHPYFLLPRAPNYVNKSIENYIRGLGITGAGNDFIDGPEVVLNSVRDAEMVALDPVLGSDYRYAQGSIRVTSPEANVLIKQASILGPQGWVLDRHGGFFEELTYSDRKGRAGSNSLYKRKRYPKKEKVNGCFVTLCYPYATNWYHWLIQSLPRLYLVNEFIDAVDGFIVPDSTYKERMIESLTYFGVPDSKIVFLGGRHIQVDNLLVPHYFSQSNVPKWLPDFFRDRTPLKGGDSEQGSLIYISRADAANRKCTNEDEVIERLSEFGFRAYHLSKMTFTEQASLFKGAKAVIGAHGAGLSNTVFCASGTNLVEIFPSSNVHSDLFHSISTAAQVGYWRLEGRPVGRNNIHSDYKVDIDTLVRIVRKITTCVDSKEIRNKTG